MLTWHVIHLLMKKGFELGFCEEEGGEAADAKGRGFDRCLQLHAKESGCLRRGIDICCTILRWVCCCERDWSMAAQWRACSATLSASSSPSCSYNEARRSYPRSKFVEGQQLQLRTAFKSLPKIAKSQVLAPRASSTTSNSGQEIKNGGQRQQDVLHTIWAKAPEPVRTFPWARAGRIFGERLWEHFWVVGKWLAIPVLAVSMLSEFSYSLVHQKALLIPAGLIGGIAFGGILKETAVELSPGIDKGDIPWHLISMGLFFSLVKFCGPYFPFWGRVTLPHFANGGLWQTFKLVNDWRKQHDERTRIEEN